MSFYNRQCNHEDLDTPLDISYIFKAKLKTACGRQSIYLARKASLISRIAFMCENQRSHGQCSHNSYRDCTDVFVTALTITHFIFQIVSCYNSG